MDLLRPSIRLVSDQSMKINESKELSLMNHYFLDSAGKRKATATGRNVRSKQPAYFLPELAHIVAAADERIPFIYLSKEVRMRFQKCIVFYTYIKNTIFVF